MRMCGMHSHTRTFLAVQNIMYLMCAPCARAPPCACIFYVLHAMSRTRNCNLRVVTFDLGWLQQTPAVVVEEVAMGVVVVMEEVGLSLLRLASSRFRRASPTPLGPPAALRMILRSLASSTAMRRTMLRSGRPTRTTCTTVWCRTR